MTPKTKLVLTIAGAVIAAPVIAVIVAEIFMTFADAFRDTAASSPTDIEWIIGWMAVAVLYWAFFTGRLRWLWKKVET